MFVYVYTVHIKKIIYTQMSSSFIKIKDVATILGVSKATLRNWDGSGKLKAHRHPFNNYRVYKVSDIEKVIEMIESSDYVIKRKKNEIKKLAIRHENDDN